MRTLINAVLVMVFFCASVFANGDMGGGGRTDCNGTSCPPPPPCTENCGLAAEETSPTGEITGSDSLETDIILIFVQEYLSQIF